MIHTCCCFLSTWSQWALQDQSVNSSLLCCNPIEKPSWFSHDRQAKFQNILSQIAKKGAATKSWPWLLCSHLFIFDLIELIFQYVKMCASFSYKSNKPQLLLLPPEFLTPCLLWDMFKCTPQNKNMFITRFRGQKGKKTKGGRKRSRDLILW